MDVKGKRAYGTGGLVRRVERCPVDDSVTDGIERYSQEDEMIGSKSLVLEVLHGFLIKTL